MCIHIYNFVKLQKKKKEQDYFLNTSLHLINIFLKLISMELLNFSECNLKFSLLLFAFVMHIKI